LLKWAQVTDLGIVDIGVLPKQYNADGRLYTSLSRLPISQLNSWGFYQYEDNPISFDNRYQYLGSSLSFNGNEVKKEYVVLSLDIETVKKSKKEEIASSRWEEMSRPTNVAGYTSLWFSDKEAMNDMLRASSDLATAIELGHLSADTKLDWKTADGTFAQVSLQDLVTIRLLLSQRQQTLYTKEANLINQIDSAETVEDILAINWN
jgi:hypothetical protein